MDEKGEIKVEKTEIDKKNTAGDELTKEDLRFLYEIDSKIQGFGYQEDPRVEEIQERRNAKEDISLVTGFKKEEISLTQEEALGGDIKYHYGNLNLTSLTSAEDLKLPDTLGKLDLRNLISAEGLKLPDTFNGDLDLSGLISAEGLKLPHTSNGDLYLNGLTSVEGLKLPNTFNGDLDLSGLTSAEGLKLPDTFNGDLYLNRLTSARKKKLRKQYPQLRIA